MAAAERSHSAVEPTTSLNRNVTTPDGGGALPGAPALTATPHSRLSRAPGTSDAASPPKTEVSAPAWPRSRHTFLSNSGRFMGAIARRDGRVH